MQKVKILKAFDVYQKGEIVSFDENSAKVYVDREVGEIVDDGATSDVARAAKPGHIVSEQMVEADPGPAAKAKRSDDGDAEVVDGDGETHTGVLPVTVNDTKEDLVARAVTAGIPEHEARPQTKTDLVAAIEAKLAEQNHPPQ